MNNTFPNHPSDSNLHSALCPHFKDIHTTLAQIQNLPKKSNFQENINFIFEALLQHIQDAPHTSFLLGTILDYLEKINQTNLFSPPLNFSAFEFWLNQSSKLPPTESRLIRAKIAGKYLPRSDYQVFFPIGMNKFYPGSHFVVAHLSPDVDTMTASFWGWLDAFAARVGSGLHVWCLPDGPPKSPITALFRDLFSSYLFTYLAETNASIGTSTSALHEPEQGTATLRDFCNQEETKLAPYLDIISVIDHHKCTLKTKTVPTTLIADVQSCNVVIAEQMFLLNDKYSLGGLSPEQIEKQLNEIAKQPFSPLQTRLFQRLLLRRLNAHKAQSSSKNSNTSYFVHPARELKEYFSFIHAILEDTDLLSKATDRDVDCLAQLLNRYHSLLKQRECEVIDFDEIPRDENFAKNAAQHLLQHPELYALYKPTYCTRESEIETNLALCGEGKPSNLFSDTKEQNGCARVGQTKLFASNFPFFLQSAHAIRQIWHDQSAQTFQNKPEIDLYLQMISTITSAEEVYRNQIGPYCHQDELWIWVPGTKKSFEHLSHFLSGFQPAMKNFIKNSSVEFIGSPPTEFITLFEPLLSKITQKESDRHIQKQTFTCAVIHFPPGAVNSRKAMISPYLPY